MKSHIFQRSELQQELRAKQSRAQNLVRQFEKIEPIFGALERIDLKCRQDNIGGYMGRLIDFIECKSEKLTPCVDIAAKGKLTSIIVDTLETAQAVLKINKEIRGGVINIYPLETIDLTRTQPKNIPAEVKSMLDLVCLTADADPRLDVLLHNIFGGVVLTKTYDQAMQVAKVHDLTCITTDLQVVYAGAFLTNAGHYNRAASDRYALYQQLKTAKAEAEQRRLALAELEKQRHETDESDMQAQQECKRAEIILQSLRRSHADLTRHKIELESQQLVEKKAAIEKIEKFMVAFNS